MAGSADAGRRWPMASRSSKINESWTPEHAASVLDEAERSGLSDRAFAKSLSQ